MTAQKRAEGFSEMLDILELEIPSARGGRKRSAMQVECDFVRDLNELDLDLVINPPPVGVAIKPLTRIRNTHHALARLVAEGRKHVEITAITGTSMSRLSVLLGDPAFRELVNYYSEQKEAVYLDVHQRLANLGMAAVEELQERLEEDATVFSNRELMELGELMLDRSVAPSKAGGSTAAPGGAPTVSINVSFAPHEELTDERLAARGIAVRQLDVLDIEEV